LKGGETKIRFFLRSKERPVEASSVEAPQTSELRNIRVPKETPTDRDKVVSILAMKRPSSDEDLQSEILEKLPEMPADELMAIESEILSKRKELWGR